MLEVMSSSTQSAVHVGTDTGLRDRSERTCANLVPALEDAAVALQEH